MASKQLAFQNRVGFRRVGFSYLSPRLYWITLCTGRIGRQQAGKFKYRMCILTAKKQCMNKLKDSHTKINSSVCVWVCFTKRICLIDKQLVRMTDFIGRRQRNGLLMTP